MPMDPFLGEIMYFAGSYAPKGWARCDGQLLPIAQSQALFSLLSIQFGGDGVNTFGLPDLRGRAPLGAPPQGGAVPQGVKAGSEFHSLTINEIPSHTHNLSVNASVSATSNSNSPAAGLSLGQTIGQNPDDGSTFDAFGYGSTANSPVQVASSMIGSAGIGQGHENRQPYTVMTACISLTGIYPSRP